MSDYQIGDLVIRVAATTPAHKMIFSPPVGHKATVKGGIYKIEGFAFDFKNNLGLILEGHHSSHPRGPAWLASNFRKISYHTPDEQDAETIELLKGDALYARRLAKHVMNNAEQVHRFKREKA